MTRTIVAHSWLSSLWTTTERPWSK